ncbi:AAA domain-containing protein [bacterium]|nr:AAA domain-containing protein [bacterium]
MTVNYRDDKEAADAFVEKYQQLKLEIGKIIVGQEDVVKSTLIGILSKGHCLLIGVPGLAKTLLVNTIASALHLKFSRIQFTPDLMPSDITGSEVLTESKQFQFVKGPLFANVILADEINRTPPKTQAALLEAMQERNVTVAGHHHRLPEPFFVLATQNPIEQEGTYPLPEAQLDRFMLNINVGYPSIEEEIEIVKRTTSDHGAQVNTVLNDVEILYFQNLVRKVPVTENLLHYAVSLVNKTRPESGNVPNKVAEYVSWGAGPRASQYLIIGAKCHALIRGKYAPDIEDVQAVALEVLRHRVVKNYKAEAEGITIDEIIKSIL